VNHASVSRAPASPALDLSVDIGQLSFQNPIIAASGTFGYGVEFAHLVDLGRLGGIVTKGLSLTPMNGAAPPRLLPSPSAMINAVGLQNIGAEAFLHLRLPELRQYGTRVICNVFGRTRVEYSRVIEVLEAGEGISAYELNLSCPNTEAGGMEFGFDPVALAGIVTDVRRLTQRQVWVKLPPTVGYIGMLARAAEQSGADALTVANSYPAASLDLTTRRPRLGSTGGGLSGAAIKPITLRLVAQAKAAVKIPVIGLGGIETAEDAVEYLMMGASAVQVGTAHFIDPRSSEQIVGDLERWMDSNKLTRIRYLHLDS
jgi:dihydroorotate dehydrogenase (NAD+) catalytic subunit